MKKYTLSLMALVATMSINAQVIKIYENGALQATYGNTLTEKYNVVVKESPRVSSISLNKTSVSVIQDATTTLTVTYTPSIASNQDVTWSSSDNNIATIDATGTVTGKLPGTATITATVADDNTITATCTVTVTRQVLLPGLFTVGAGPDGILGTADDKKVQFTNGNLYWDGSAFKIEANQTDGLNTTSAGATLDLNHVNFFDWTNLIDYQAGTNSPYDYKGGRMTTWSVDNKYFCGEDNKITADGTPGLFALSKDEWEYLINKRSNNFYLNRSSVKVTNNGTTYPNCFIIAPDDYDYTTNPLKQSYTLSEINSLGLVCLPAAGKITHDGFGGFSFEYGGIYGFYWTSTCSSEVSNKAFYIYFYAVGPFTNSTDDRALHQSLRLVSLPQ